MTTTALKTEQEKRDYAKGAATTMVANLRESNADYATRTGEPSTVSDADYAQAERELEASLLRVAGLKPLKERR